MTIRRSADDRRAGQLERRDPQPRRRADLRAEGLGRLPAAGASRTRRRILGKKESGAAVSSSPSTSRTARSSATTRTSRSRPRCKNAKASLWTIVLQETHAVPATPEARERAMVLTDVAMASGGASKAVLTRMAIPQGFTWAATLLTSQFDRDLQPSGIADSGHEAGSRRHAKRRAPVRAALGVVVRRGPLGIAAALAVLVAATATGRAPGRLPRRHGHRAAQRHGHRRRAASRERARAATTSRSSRTACCRTSRSSRASGSRSRSRSCSTPARAWTPKLAVAQEAAIGFARRLGPHDWRRSSTSTTTSASCRTFTATTPRSKRRSARRPPAARRRSTTRSTSRSDDLERQRAGVRTTRSGGRPSSCSRTARTRRASRTTTTCSTQSKRADVGGLRDRPAVEGRDARRGTATTKADFVLRTLSQGNGRPGVFRRRPDAAVRHLRADRRRARQPVRDRLHVQEQEARRHVAQGRGPLDASPASTRAHASGYFAPAANR